MLAHVKKGFIKLIYNENNKIFNFISSVFTPLHNLILLKNYYIKINFFQEISIY